MTTFALVHGAWHSAWCWQPLADELRSRGHVAVAMDLPCDDPTAGIEEYVSTVLHAVDAAGVPAEEEVVLVGHSLGGLTVGATSVRRRIREVVFLCAFLPEPGNALHVPETVFGDEWTRLSALQIVNDDGSTSWPAEPAIEAFYHDCSPALAVEAAAQLRPQAWKIVQDPCPLDRVPDVARRAIVTVDDRCLVLAGTIELAARWDAPVTTLGGGHSPMLTQPAALADALLAGD